MISKIIKKLLNKKIMNVLLLFLVGSIAAITSTILATTLFKLSLEREKERAETNNLIQDNELTIARIRNELKDLKSQDQYLINKDLETEIANIQKTYGYSISAYEKLLKLQDRISNTNDYDDLYTKAIIELSKREYENATKTLDELVRKIDDEEAKLAAAQIKEAQANIPLNNAPPGSGYSRQTVSSEAGNFVVSLVAADISNTRVIVDTASDGDCGNDCPVLSLAEYVGRNGAFAGVNGSYFCPASYPSCAGKTNSFDTLAMNKNKHYFNSDNNVYSNVPAVIFGNGWIRFVSASSQWGRDTSIDGVLANHPLMVADGNVVYSGDSDPKKTSRGNRSFVANRGNSVYIGVVHGATVAESAQVMKALGMENALNLDNGGSTALWSSGYKVGPGRSLPNVILFVRK